MTSDKKCKKNKNFRNSNNKRWKLGILLVENLTIVGQVKTACKVLESRNIPIREFNMYFLYTILNNSVQTASYQHNWENVSIKYCSFIVLLSNMMLAYSKM